MGLNTNLVFYKLAPGESTKIRRAKVGQLLPLRGEPVSGWVSNTLRGLVVRLKSGLFLVQVYMGQQRNTFDHSRVELFIPQEH